MLFKKKLELIQYFNDNLYNIQKNNTKEIDNQIQKLYIGVQNNSNWGYISWY